MEERLQKILSAYGVGSRRAMEQYIKEGRVAVNGVTAKLGEKADSERDCITVDGVVLTESPKPVYIMLNKPQGYVTTLSDDRGRATVAELVVGCGVRVWPVGRLDYDSEGLLLLTNDGDLTHRLTHPGHEVEKEYRVEATGDLKKGLPILCSPMELDGMPLLPALIRDLGEDGKRHILSITIREGKNRQVRRMCAAAGLTVVRLCRIREGNLHLDKALAPGAWRHLSEAEIANLRDLSG